MLGFIAANGSIPQRVLTELGLTIDKVREQVKQLPAPSAEWQTSDLTMTPRAKRLLEQTAQRAGGGRVRAEVLLVSLVRDREGSGAKVLDALKVTEAMVLTALGKQQPPPNC